MIAASSFLWDNVCCLLILGPNHKAPCYPSNEALRAQLGLAERGRHAMALLSRQHLNGANSDLMLSNPAR